MSIIFMVEHLCDQVYKNREFTKSAFVFCIFKVKLAQQILIQLMLNTRQHK